MSDFEIIEISDKDQWQELNRRVENKTFLQSWTSKEWRMALGQKVKLFGVFDRQKLIAGALIAEMPLFKWRNQKANFWLLPHGPIIDQEYWNHRAKILSTLIDHIRLMAQQDQRVAFIRVQPAWPDNSEDRQVFKKLSFREAPIFIVPEVTWCLDIRPNEEEILRGMRKTTRYLIRKGLSNSDLEVRMGSDKDDLADFLTLYRQTVGRHQFQAFSLNYLEKELKCLSSEDEITIFNAYYQKNPIASAMIVFHQKGAYYHQGASEGQQPKDAPGSYLIQWEAIREAKKRGCSVYNFWGIAHNDNHRHAYRGLSLFKKGFGGYRLDYLPTQDLVTGWQYWPNYLIEKCRRWKRKV
jgi:lipid II:glycine glycyltransferase (peptidoglycan interpeptide bridge formation enzyme)